jgi:hypothetical protein
MYSFVEDTGFFGKDFSCIDDIAQFNNDTKKELFELVYNTILKEFKGLGSPKAHLFILYEIISTTIIIYDRIFFLLKD